MLISLNTQAHFCWFQVKFINAWRQGGSFHLENSEMLISSERATAEMLISH